MSARAVARRGRRTAVVAAALVAATAVFGACCASAQTAPAEPGWREFHGTWTANGSRQAIGLGGDRRAAIGNFRGSLMLAGAARPAVGFFAEAVLFSDSASGMVGRAVWTDDRGDQVFSELRGDGTMTGNRIVGSFLGGTGRFAGATGGYEFTWKFVLAAEDGALQGQSIGLKGRVRIGAPPATPNTASTRP